MKIGALVSLLAILFLPGFAWGAECTNSQAIGVARVLKLNTKSVGSIGGSRSELPLAHGEIVLTFDDGPLPGPTPRILDILKNECIEATFFLIGKRAAAYPQIVTRIRDDGHSIGSHSNTHRELSKLPYDEAADDIQRGYEAVEMAAFGSLKDRPRLFRFPGFKSTPELVEFVRSHHGTIANADISPADWRGQPADVTMDRLRKLFDRNDRGILLLHANQKNTVQLLPMVIAEMKSRNMRVVHLTVE